MAKIHNNAVARGAIDEYKTCVTSAEKEMIETFLTGFELTIKHSDAEKKALDYFEEKQIGNDESNSTIFIQLKKVGSFQVYNFF